MKITVYKPLAFNKLPRSKRHSYGEKVYVLPSRALNKDKVTMEYSEYLNIKKDLAKETKENAKQWRNNHGLA